MNKKIKLTYLSEEGLHMLKSTFDDNIPSYLSGEKEHFQKILQYGEYLIDSTYEAEDFTSQLKYTGNNDTDDLHNIKVVYEALKHIPPYIMMEDRFWAALNHTVMWEYIQKRRKKEFNVEGAQKNIYNSFFTHTNHGVKRGTYVNCVSRLWWAGKLTYQKGVNNPYELTEELCKSGFASTILILSSSNIMSRNETRLSFLKVIGKLRKMGIEVKRQDIVLGIRYLNLVAGSTLIDILSAEELECMILKYYNKAVI